jgi:hypothetical protein
MKGFPMVEKFNRIRPCLDVVRSTSIHMCRRWIEMEFSLGSTPTHVRSTPTHVDWCKSDYIQTRPYWWKKTMAVLVPRCLDACAALPFPLLGPACPPPEPAFRAHTRGPRCQTARAPSLLTRIAICAIPNLLLQHPDETLATYVQNS